MSTQQVAKVAGRFARTAPQPGSADGCFAISHRWVAEKSQRRRSTGRWYRLTNEATGRTVHRVLTFDPTMRYAGSEGPGVSDLALDWTGWLSLIDYADDTGAEVDLVVRRARWWHFPRIAVTHPDPVARVALQVSAVAFVLGIIPYVAQVVGWLV